MSGNSEIFCSFCGGSQNGRDRIVSAPEGRAFICDACVDDCAAICAEGRKERRALLLLAEVKRKGT